MSNWMRMMLPPRRMTPPMGQSGVPTGPGIPSGVAAPDSDFFDSAGLPQMDYSHLDDNVIAPQRILGSSRLGRGLDNALLSAATFQPGQTTGENISAVAKNLIGLEPNREQMNFSRQMSPYLSMEPLLKMKSEMNDMDYRSALAEHSRAMAEYYREGGRAMRQDIKQGDDGNYYRVNDDATATPIMQNQTTHYQTPDMQLGNTTIHGNDNSVSGQVPFTGRLPVGRGTGGTMIERQIAFEEAQRGRPYSADERAQRMATLSGAITGNQTSNRYSNTPGYMGQTSQDAFHTEMTPVQTQFDRLNKMDGVERLTENTARKQNGQPSVEQEIQSLQGQQQDIMSRYHMLPQGSSTGTPAGQGPVDIPPLLTPPAGPGYNPAQQAPTRTPMNIGGIPATAVGVTPQQAAQAIQPPQAQSQSKQLSVDAARQYLQKAGGNRAKAEAMATQDGYQF